MIPISQLYDFQKKIVKRIIEHLHSKSLYMKQKYLLFMQTDIYCNSAELNAIIRSYYFR